MVLSYLITRLKNVTRKISPGLFTILKNIKGKISSYYTIKKDENFNRKFKPYKAHVLKPPILNRKKILHIVSNFWTGGSSRLVVDLFEHLGHIYEQKVITRDIPEYPAYVGLPIEVSEELNSTTFILDELNNFRPDLVHVHYLGHQKDKWGKQDWQWYDNAYRALEKYGCPVVQNINIPTPPYDNEMVSQYVYVSNYVKEKFSQPQHQNSVIYPGSDFAHFNREELSTIPENCIGMVYRLERDKINENSIHVFIEVVKRRKETKVLIVGGGSLLEHFQMEVENAGVSDSFTFTGYVGYKDLPKYYKKMSIFIAPIHTESFGQVTPMAMNMGIPVAGYHAGALSEIIDNDNLLAPEGDFKKLSEIVVNLLNNQNRRLEIGVANQMRAKKLFSVEAMIHSYQEIYRKELEPESS
ncbi:N/A [soil metagenome]